MMKSRRIWTTSSISYTEKIEVSIRGLLSITATLDTQEDEEPDEEDSYTSYDPQTIEATRHGTSLISDRLLLHHHTILAGRIGRRTFVHLLHLSLVLLGGLGRELLGDEGTELLIVCRHTTTRGAVLSDELRMALSERRELLG